MQVTKEIKLNFFSPDANSNKVWIGRAFSDGRFVAEWGRVADGANLASQTKQFGTASAAEAMLERKKREKIGKGYRETAVLSGVAEVKAVDGAELKRIAAAQIAGATDSGTTRELVEYLAEVNIHHICGSTSISYDAANATFSTPLGVLTPSAVAEARQILSAVKDFNDRSEYYSDRRASYVRNYFQLVPKSFGRRIPPAHELLAGVEAIAKESDILDALEAAVAQASGNPSDARLFKCRLSKLPHWTEDGRARFREIRQLFESTRNAHHAGTSALKLARVYEVEIEDMKARFDAAAARLGNVRSDQWHGTKASNLLSILKSGLMIPKAGAAHCTGRMFGDGIYTSIQSTKALNYATDFWNRSGAQNQRTFMFLCDVALGRTFKPTSRATAFPARGTDSTWVEAGTAGVLNHECIVYSLDQINLRYLCEFAG